MLPNSVHVYYVLVDVLKHLLVCLMPAGIVVSQHHGALPMLSHSFFSLFVGMIVADHVGLSCLPLSEHFDGGMALHLCEGHTAGRPGSKMLAKQEP